MYSLPDRARSRAVLIGTSSFDHLPPLLAVRGNLEDLRAALTDPEHGIIAPENCEIVDGPGSVREFMTELRRVVARTDDFLLVYYAGHGLRHDTKDELYLSVRETETEALAESAVRFETVKEVLENSPARTNLLVLDCCYSGMALGTMSGIAVEQRELEVRGSAVMASSPKNRKSHSPVGRRHTAFTGKMISFLEHGSPVAGEQLTVNSLYKRMSVALVEENFPRPLLKVSDTSGDLLVRRPDQSSPPLVDPPTVPRGTPAAAPAEPATQLAAELVGPAVLRRRALWLRALWIFTGFVVAMALGDGIALLSGYSVPNASGGLTLSVTCGLTLLLLHRRWRHGRRGPVLPRSIRPVPGVVMASTGLVFCIVMITTGLLVSTSGKSFDTTAIGLLIAFAEGTVLCGYLVYRGVRRRTRQR